MSKLVKMLRKAHATEIGAYLAYEGHWQSVSDPQEQREIKNIQRDEMRHRVVVYKMLRHLDARPSIVLDFAFGVVGRIMGFLCKYTGRFMPMVGAKIIERIGATSYFDMIDTCVMEGHPEFGMTLLQLGMIETEHEEYFNLKIRDLKQIK